MKELPAHNEGFRVLEEAVYVVGPPDASAGGRAIPVGLGIPQPGSEHPQRPEDFQHWRTDQLMAFVERLGPTLAPSDLCYIHEIAIHRLAERHEGDDARSLSQLVMKVAASRLTS